MTDSPAHDARRTPGPCMLWGIACLPFVAILVYQIATTRFLCDDAFISFRYARNLVEGHGLVFNRGEHVEGYTNLLWTLEVAGLWCLGLRPEVSAHALSLALTAGTLALVVAAALRLDGQPHRRLVAWIALGLVACSPSFAVWSTSGLETRQFTFLVVLASFLSTQAASRARLRAASLVFAAAALTRPEGLLIFGCAFAWRLVQDKVAGRLRLADVVALAWPFAAVVACHFGWRHGYYGEWLPNTYYAKYVAAWYESGFPYLAAAAIELGAWVWVPLAWIAMRRRAAAHDLAPALPFVLVGVHALYVARIGGDHFEYRPLDFYLPLLAVPAAAGLLHLAGIVVHAVRAGRATPTAAAWLAAAATAPLLVYSHAIGGAALAIGVPPHVLPDEVTTPPVDHTSAPLLRFAPGLLPLCTVLEPLRANLHRQCNAVPAPVHRNLGRALTANFAACERLPAGVFPATAIAAAISVGVKPFYLHQLAFVDVHGLTDATVARTPVAADNRRRRMAHDRIASPQYLRARGVGIDVEAVAPSRMLALARAELALRIDDGHWLPVHTLDLEMARAMPADRVAARHRIDSTTAAANRVRLDGAAFDGVRMLATFEAGAPGLTWQTSGDVAMRPARLATWGAAGAQQLSSEPTDDGDAGRGTARSSPFVAESGTVLALLLAGQREPGVALRLCRGTEVVASFFPRLPDRFEPVICPLDAWTGESLHLELHDGGPGWLGVDHVFLARRAADAPDPESTAWAPNPSLAALVQATPLPIVGGRAGAGPMTITVANPLPCAVRLQVALDGPAGTSLLRGDWRRPDGAATPGEAPAGTTVCLPAYLSVPDGFDPRREPVFVILHCSPTLRGAGSPVRIDVPVAWR